MSVALGRPRVNSHELRWPRITPCPPLATHKPTCGDPTRASMTSSMVRAAGCFGDSSPPHIWTASGRRRQRAPLSVAILCVILEAAATFWLSAPGAVRCGPFGTRPNG
jgi:hypothetical protein